jgi:hypothetical protein
MLCNVISTPRIPSPLSATEISRYSCDLILLLDLGIFSCSALNFIVNSFFRPSLNIHGPCGKRIDHSMWIIRIICPCGIRIPYPPSCVQDQPKYDSSDWSKFDIYCVRKNTDLWATGLPNWAMGANSSITYIRVKMVDEIPSRTVFEVSLLIVMVPVSSCSPRWERMDCKLVDIALKVGSSTCDRCVQVIFGTQGQDMNLKLLGKLYFGENGRSFHLNLPYNPLVLDHMSSIRWELAFRWSQTSFSHQNTPVYCAYSE